MNNKMKAAFACYFMASLIILLFGVVYTVRNSFMPYHAAATGMPWADVPANFQVLIIALMRAFGGACIGLAVGIFVMLFKQFPQGNNWTRWCIPLLLIIASLGGMHAMAHVMLHTDASPPWFASVVIIILSVVGFVLSKPVPND